MKKQKLNYRFHDPNDPAVAAEYILKVFVEANQKKVEKVIREAGAQGREKAEKMKDDKEEDDKNKTELFEGNVILRKEGT